MCSCVTVCVQPCFNMFPTCAAAALAVAALTLAAVLSCAPCLFTTSTIKVSPWFPNSPKECSDVATVFFGCFSNHSEHRGDGKVTSQLSAFPRCYFPALLFL